MLEKELAQDVQKVEQLQQSDNAEFSDHDDDEQTQQATVAAQVYIVNPCTSAATQAAKPSSKLTVDRNLLDESKRKYCHLFIHNCGRRALKFQPHWIDLTGSTPSMTRTEYCARCAKRIILWALQVLMMAGLKIHLHKAALATGSMR